MASQRHLEVLRKGVETWNSWKEEDRMMNPNHLPDFSGADLRGFSIKGATLDYADFTGADLSGAAFRECSFESARFVKARLDWIDLWKSDLTFSDFTDASLVKARLMDAFFPNSTLTRATLHQTILTRASFGGSDLSGALLQGAVLYRAYLPNTNFSGADLTGADLEFSVVNRANFFGARLIDCKVYGVSAWDLNLEGTIQRNLRITEDGKPAVHVDRLDVAQFVHLLLDNKGFRSVIDTITTKVVLILGRFSEERRPVLDHIRESLRERDYVPIIFDFEKPANRDLTETISALAHLARFVIADLTDARSLPQELMAIVPSLPSVPVQTILLESQSAYAMFEHIRRFPWVLPPHLYRGEEHLAETLTTSVIEPLEEAWLRGKG